MKKEKVYLYTGLALSLIVLLISLLTLNYLFSRVTHQLLESQLESSQREIREIQRLLEGQLRSGIGQEQVATSLQKSIENTDTQTGFVCMYDTVGKEICHPDPSRIGQQIDQNNSVVRPITGSESRSFYELLNEGKATGGLRTFSARGRGSEIIYVQPIANTSWMLASHANLRAIHRQLDELHTQFLLVQGLAGTLLVLLSFLAVRWIGNRYQQQLEGEKNQLTDEVKSLTALNASLVSYQSRVQNQPMESTVDGQAMQAEEAGNRRRILTYWKDELVVISTDQIAYFHTEQSLTYIYCQDAKVYTSNTSLDELQKELDAEQFFRANRQFLISIRAIEKIFMYGKHQLKIAISPPPSEDILISKNKAAEFKQWLNR
ncbi:LytTR family transcriptional regulator DNA-binding domain-containing protein [Spirosoma koreense]